MSSNTTKYDIVLLGTEKSGFMLLAGILNSSPDIKICCKSSYRDFFVSGSNAKSTDTHIPLLIHLINLQYNVYINLKDTLLERLNIFHDNFPHTKYIWLIRDPASSVMSCSEYNNIETDKALTYWYEYNIIIWYYMYTIPNQCKFIIKYEDLLTKKKLIQRLYEFIDIPYNKQYLHYGDFDQPIISDKTFQRGVIDMDKIGSHKIPSYLQQIWKKYYKSDIINLLGYDKSFMDL